MISYLKIKGFQPYKEETVFDFSSNVNVIVGTGSAGKSTVIRTINWIVNNRPLNESIINDDCDEAEGILGLVNDDGTKTEITRRKDRKGHNTYLLRTNDGEILEFNSFGQNPPKEIQEAINFSDLNIQWQENPYFMVYDSSGQIAKSIRKISGLEEIDEIIKKLTSDLKLKKGESSSIEVKVEKIDEELEKLVKFDFDVLEEQIQQLETFLGNKEENEQRILKIKRFIENLQAVRNSLSKLFDPGNLCSEIEKLIQENEFLEKRAQELSRKINEYLSLCVEKQISIVDCNKYCEEIDSSISQFELNENLITTFKSKISSYKSINIVLEKKNLSISQLEEDIIELNSQLEECPYCGETLTEESKQKLLGI